MISGYPARKVIAVDVDGTLIDATGTLRAELVEWLRARHAAGYVLYLWSAAGSDHAREIAERHHLLDLFAAILSKPGFAVDDQGWNWTRFAPCYHPGQITPPDRA